MPYKVTLMYNLSSGGAKRPGSTESYLFLSPAANLDDAALHTACVNFMNARTELMGNNAAAIGYRVSTPGVRSRSVRRLVNTDLGSAINPAPVQQQGSMDIAYTSVQCEGFSAKKQRSNKYLAGLPDAFITTAGTGGPNFSAPGLLNYMQVWNSFKAILLNGTWGFKAVADLPPDQPFDILEWTQLANAPFECQISVPNPQALWSPGDVVHIRGVLMVEPWQPRPIGRFKIRAMATDGTQTTYTLRDSAEFDATQVEQPGTIEQIAYESVAYATFEIANQSRHKRGPGPILPVGRSRARLRRQVS